MVHGYPKTRYSEQMESGVLYLRPNLVVKEYMESKELKIHHEKEGAA